MATNKHAAIRYNALDLCFSNRGKRYDINMLVEACNKAIREFSGEAEGVKKRQVYDDIRFMESEQGWSIPLERVKEGRKVYFQYSDSSFSIKNRGITQTEADQFRETLSIISRFKGLKQLEWIDEVMVRLQDNFIMDKNNEAMVSFEQNPYLEGMNHFAQLFDAVKKKTVIQITYKSFKQAEPLIMMISPWHLKQYNNRWFLFGHNHEMEKLSNLAIDRIHTIKESNAEFFENTQIDFDDYFDDVVGVTVNEASEVSKILLRIDSKTWPYIKSKPLHHSQKRMEESDQSVLIELELKINHEFTSLLFSYLDAIEIIEPISLRNRVKEIARNIYQNNF